MQKLALPFALAIALAACGSQPEAAKPASPAAPAAPAPTNVAQPVTAPAPAAAPAVDALSARFDQVLAGSWRSDKNKARDGFRHPKETLGFFGLKSGMTVIEITPGGGWYTEILAPLLKGDGKLIAAIVDPASASSDGAKKYLDKSNTNLKAKLAADAATFGDVEVREFSMVAPKFGEPGSVDMVVTFRNVHNFMGWKTDQVMFKAMADVLKPGGVLGVTDHRAAPGTDLAASSESGYLPEEYVIKLATDAGLRLDSKSEINANPKDTKDYAKGVWTLPPSLTLGETDKEKYLAIGESDRMTLKFVKPAADQVFDATEKQPASASTDAAKR